MLLGMAEVDYLSGFVGVCLIQYFYRKRTSTAFAILRCLLTWRIVFIRTLPSRILDTVDVVKMAVNVSRFSRNVFCHIRLWAFTSSLYYLAADGEVDKLSSYFESLKTVCSAFIPVI